MSTNNGLSKRPEILPSELVRQGWCRKHLAEDRHGEPCRPDAAIAFGFCMEGAVHAAGLGGWQCDGPTLDFWNLLFSILLHKTGSTLPWRFNDTPGRTQGEVIAVLEQAEEGMGWHQ